MRVATGPLSAKNFVSLKREFPLPFNRIFLLARILNFFLLLFFLSGLFSEKGQIEDLTKNNRKIFWFDLQF
jgi:hypothetical protein